MRITFYGAGGIGGYFGGRLALAGEKDPDLQVSFIARGGQLRALQSDGLRVDSIKGDFWVKTVRATENPAEIGTVDAVIVCVKAWQVPEVAAAMRPLVGEDTVVVPLENGVEAPAQLAEVLGARPVLGGLCHIVSLIVAPGHIRHAAMEPHVAFGELDGSRTARVERLKAAFELAGVWTEVPDDIQAAMWEKFLFIASVSGVGAVGRAPMGVLRSVEPTRRLLEQSMQEIFAVAAARGVHLADDVVAKTMTFVDNLPPGATASMQRDIIDGRRSELDYQNGAVVRLGAESGVPTPANAFLYASLLPQELKARGEL